MLDHHLLLVKSPIFWMKSSFFWSQIWQNLRFDFCWLKKLHVESLFTVILLKTSKTCYFHPRFMLQSLQCGHFQDPSRWSRRTVDRNAVDRGAGGRHRCLALRPQGRRGDPARAEGASRCTGTARAAGCPKKYWLVVWNG